MLTVACVQVNNYLGRGEEYVSKLRSMVARNLKQPHDFVVIGDGEGRHGWWAKTLMFKPGLFQGRVLYLDLDCVITGSLDELVETKGIIYLKDWCWKNHVYGSGVMVWDAGEHSEIYERYDETVPVTYRGDQDFITVLGGWAALPKPPTLCSYRYHCRGGLPEGCIVASMHGHPKPHEITEGWVPEMWR